MDKITISLTLRKDVYDAIKELAGQDRRSVTGQIEWTLMEYLREKGGQEK